MRATPVGLKNIPIIIFADGASSGNPGPSGWGTIILTPDHRLIELGGHDSHSTNNRMEMIAAISGIERVIKESIVENPSRSIRVYTDSNYLIQGIEKWIFGWQKRGWVNSAGQPVANQDLWKHLLALTQEHPIQWKHVRGHSGIAGNERADEIAVGFSKGRHPRLFHGSLTEYPHSILPLP